MSQSHSEGAPAPFKVRSVTVIEQSGTDLIRIETDLPLAVYPYEGSPQYLEMHVSKGSGVAYAETHLKMGPTVVKL